MYLERARGRAEAGVADPDSQARLEWCDAQGSPVAAAVVVAVVRAMLTDRSEIVIEQERQTKCRRATKRQTLNRRSRRQAERAFSSCLAVNQRAGKFGMGRSGRSFETNGSPRPAILDPRHSNERTISS